MLKLQHMFKSCCLQRDLCARLAKGQRANFTYQHMSSFTPMLCRWLSAKGLNSLPVGRQASLSCSAGWETETWVLASLEPLPSTVPERGIKAFWWSFINPKRFPIHETSPASIRIQALLYLLCLLCTGKHRADAHSSHNAALENKVLVEEPCSSSAAGPSKAMLMDSPSFLCRNLHLRENISAQVDIPRLA